MEAKKSATYTPRPISIVDVSVPADLHALIELLAEHNHDLWASQRLREGWSYGPYRDDTKRTHPCLVPYEALPETEKEYDRMAAVGTIRAIIKMGYSICPLDPMSQDLSSHSEL